MSIDDIIEMFNNGDLEVEKYFNDYDTFFTFLNKRGRIDDIDPRNAANSINWENYYLIWLHDNNKPLFNKYVDEAFSDVVIENGVPYLDIADRGDLSGLFCKHSRNSLDRSTIESILNGEGEFYDNWNDPYNMYDDVIDVLDEKNLSHLGEYIVKTLEGIEVSPSTELLEEIAKNQGHPEYVEVNMENVGSIIGNEETMDELLDDELSDLKSELTSVFNNAYNSAYESQLYDSIWKELNDYFSGKGEWITRPHPFKQNTEIHRFKVPIINFYQHVTDYLHTNAGYTQGSLEYFGSYLGMLQDKEDCLDARIYDYPDSSEIEKHINIYLGDYI